jgi:hypothetical protein
MENKYKFFALLEHFKILDSIILESCDSITAAHDKVVIDPESLAKNKELIVNRKGPSFFEQLKVLANQKKILTVTAIKRVNRNSSNFVDSNSSTFDEEVDVVNMMNPGNFHSPMTLPLTILKKVSDYNGSFNIPLDDEYQNKPNLDSEIRDEYNSGKQPRGTRKFNK